MTAAELRRRRAAAQLLAGADSPAPVQAVAHLLAVQAQDLRAARLALRARGAAATAAEVDAALGDDRSLVAGWLMRGTLHLVARDDYAWLHALTAPLSAATSRRRLGRLGGDPEKAVPAIVRALAEAGPLPRAAIGERLAAVGIRTEGQILPHLLALAAADGGVVLGPVRDGAQCFALARDWLGPGAALPARAAALAELAERYLRGHGPATEADLAAWTGLPLRDARAGLAAIAGELAQGAGWSTSPAARSRRRASRPACSGRSTRTCSAGATAASPSRPSTRGGSTRAAASYARPRSRTGAPSARGRSRAAAS
jgi:hypothetical protein